MAGESSPLVHDVLTIEDFAMAASWQCDEHSLHVAVLSYSFLFLSQFADPVIRAESDLRWEQVWREGFREAHQRGLLVADSYSSSREDRMSDPALQVQALWVDSMAEVYAHDDGIMPCSHCAGRGRWLCVALVRVAGW